MDKKVILGGLVGGAVTLLFAFTKLLVLCSVFADFAANSSNVVVGFISLILSPVGGGFNMVA